MCADWCLEAIFMVVKASRELREVFLGKSEACHSFLREKEDDLCFETLGCTPDSSLYRAVVRSSQFFL